ncbi:hypothetical protein ABEB36_012004 [Hypothenemus hampei]|uniref:Uncharacterized protein n=1 Tax=Hypothenemus hampei TaxID=57062 RepID=A0ABD1E9U3_HYPHA
MVKAYGCRMKTVHVVKAPGFMESLFNKLVIPLLTGKIQGKTKFNQMPINILNEELRLVKLKNNELLAFLSKLTKINTMIWSWTESY